MNRAERCVLVVGLLLVSRGLAQAQPEPPSAAGAWTTRGIEAIASSSSAPSSGDGTWEPISGTTHARRVYEEFDQACSFDATRVRVDIIDTAANRRLPEESYSYCGTLSRPPSAELAPSPVPIVALSPEEVWGLLPIEQPSVAISPRVKGLVGYETWLWDEGETNLRLPQPLTLGEWQIDVDARAVHFRWDMGDGGVIEGDSPGSEGSPADAYTYQYPCTCQVTVTVTWAGSYTVSGPGFGPVTIDLGTREFTGPPLHYPVREVQAVIVD